MKNILLSLATLKVGTGKSTLVKFIIAALGVDTSEVAYACFTGKAAEVLRHKGNENAMTLHRLLYDSFPKSGGGFYRKPKDIIDYQIVVVDEISMAPKSMIEMLLKHNVYVIMLGDPMQLPVIDKNETHDYLDHPHIFLDEVMRQAAESEIIQMTMKIRAGEDIQPFKGNEVIVIPENELLEGHLRWADQIITATNAKKDAINAKMRELLGYEGIVQDGERVICTRNYWEDFDENGEGVLVNGLTGTIHNPFTSFRRVPGYIKVAKHTLPTVCGSFTPDYGATFNHVEMDKNIFEEGKPCVDWKDSFTLNRMKFKIGDVIPREFAYAYAISCHKAQGSEYDKVLVLEEGFPYSKAEHARWLYTACTRASKKLVLVRG